MSAIATGKRKNGSPPQNLAYRRQATPGEKKSRDQDREKAFGSGSSKRSLKAQLPEGKESQTENLGRALPRLTKAPIEPVAQSPMLKGKAKVTQARPAELRSRRIAPA